MTMLENIDTYLTEACDSFDLTLMKVDAVMEAALRQLDINYTKAELKVMNENGTADDYRYLCEEADNGLLETISKSIKTIIDNIVKFFSGIKDRIISAFTKKETKDVIDKIDKKTKLFPLLRKKKVIVENIDKQEKLCEEHKSKLLKLRAKACAGNAVSNEDFEKEHESFISKHRTAIGVGAAVTISLGTLLALFKSGAVEKLMNKFSKNEKDTISVLKSSTAGDYSKIKNPQGLVIFSRLFSKTSQIEAEDQVRSAFSMFSALKKAVSGFGKKVVKEAAENDGSDTMKAGMEEVSSADTGEGDDMSISKEEAFGDDPINSVVPEVDDEPDTDPWDDVMRDLSVGGAGNDSFVDPEDDLSTETSEDQTPPEADQSEGQSGDNAGGEQNASMTESEDGLDLDSMYEFLLENDIDSYTTDYYEGSSLEGMLDDFIEEAENIYVEDEMMESTSPTFDMLMSEIDKLY